MPKYIDVDLLISELRALNEQERLEYMGVYDCIKSMPIVNSIVQNKDCSQCKYFERGPKKYPCSQCKKCYIDKFQPIVHCVDCKYLMFSDCYGECSKGHKGIVQPDDYCSYGERKENKHSRIPTGKPVGLLKSNPT